MGKDSRIEWTTHTFNPWWGCVKVSPACKHCYAEAWAKRVGAAVWGTKAPRRFFGTQHWAEPLRWNAQALKDGNRPRVFCASMADVFEDRRELDPWREKLAELIAATPALDWLLLTKRPAKAVSLAPWGSDWPLNVWLGTTAENQTWAERRIPALVRTPAKLRFLSCEPVLGPIDLTPWIKALHWVIAGGESGGRSRPTDPNWFRSLRDQCTEADRPFLFKQWGNWAPNGMGGENLVRQSKKAAGRVLDGGLWDGMPEAPALSSSLRFTNDVTSDIVSHPDCPADRRGAGEDQSVGSTPANMQVQRAVQQSRSK